MRPCPCRRRYFYTSSLLGPDPDLPLSPVLRLGRAWGSEARGFPGSANTRWLESMQQGAPSIPGRGSLFPADQGGQGGWHRLCCRVAGPMSHVCLPALSRKTRPGPASLLAKLKHPHLFCPPHCLIPASTSPLGLQT